MLRSPEIAAVQQPVRMSRVLVTVVELVALMTFASVLVLAVVGIPMLAAWVQIGR